MLKMVVMTVMMMMMMMVAKRTNPAISGVVVPRTNQAWISSAHGVVDEDLDHDEGDDIYIIMQCLSRKIITSFWESPVTT